MNFLSTYSISHNISFVFNCKKVEQLLPPNQNNTMSSIRQYLSLNELNSALGLKDAKMVFDACRGIDDEPVRETKGALSKSITAFKSFGPITTTHHDIQQLRKWITLLITDIFTRVSADLKRNNRFPKICTIQYYCKRDTSEYLYDVFLFVFLSCFQFIHVIFNKMFHYNDIVVKFLDKDRTGCSIRTPFPSLVTSDKIESFVDKVQEIIQSKCGNYPIVRLGLSATGFVERVPQSSSISSFFQSGVISDNKDKMTSNETSPKKERKGNINTWKNMKKGKDNQHVLIESFIVKTKTGNDQSQALGSENGNVSAETVNNESLHVPLPLHNQINLARSDNNAEEEEVTKEVTEQHNCTSTQIQDSPDLEYAKKLQASYDRENEILSRTALFHGDNPIRRRQTKKLRIDSFFKTRK